MENGIKIKYIALHTQHKGFTERKQIHFIELGLSTKYRLYTWILVPPSNDMNILRSIWLFSTKLRLDGTVDKLKPWLVTKGFEQEVGLDYLENIQSSC